MHLLGDYKSSDTPVQMSHPNCETVGIHSDIARGTFTAQGDPVCKVIVLNPSGGITVG